MNRIASLVGAAGVAAAAATVLIVFTIVPVALVYRLLRRYELSML
jgi:iron(III) transport system permease protein